VLGFLRTRKKYGFFWFFGHGYSKIPYFYALNIAIQRMNYKKKELKTYGVLESLHHTVAC